MSLSKLEKKCKAVDDKTIEMYMQSGDYSDEKELMEKENIRRKKAGFGGKSNRELLETEKAKTAYDNLKKSVKSWNSKYKNRCKIGIYLHDTKKH